MDTVGCLERSAILRQLCTVMGVFAVTSVAPKGLQRQHMVPRGLPASESMDNSYH